MKRNWTLLLTSFLLVLALTACGRDNNVNDPVPNDVPTTEDSMGNPGSNQNALDNATDGNRTDNNLTDGSTADGSLTGNVGNDIANGIDGVEDTLTGDNSASKNGISSQNKPGVSYEQMLRNARVHDRDGNLRDHENAVTPGSVY